MKRIMIIEWALKGTICLVVAFMAAGFCGAQTAAAKTVKITAESGEDWDINKALNKSRRDPQNHYIVKVPKGIYKVGREFDIPGNTTLDLRGVTLVQISIGRRILEFGDLYEDGHGGGYKGGKNIKILGGTLDAGTRSDAANICTFSHVQNVTFSGTTFKYLPKKKLKGRHNPHMIEFAASKNVTIKNCKFYNNSKCRPNNEAIQIESVQNDGTGTGPDLGECDGTQCKNITIKDCYFKGFNYGCGSNHLSKKDHFSNMKFIRNIFVRAKKYAICLFGYRKVLISGNKLKKSGSLYQDQGSKGVKVRQG